MWQGVYSDLQQIYSKNLNFGDYKQSKELCVTAVHAKMVQKKYLKHETLGVIISE